MDHVLSAKHRQGHQHAEIPAHRQQHSTAQHSGGLLATWGLQASAAAAATAANQSKISTHYSYCQGGCVCSATCWLVEKPCHITDNSDSTKPDVAGRKAKTHWQITSFSTCSPTPALCRFEHPANILPSLFTSDRPLFFWLQTGGGQIFANWTQQPTGRSPQLLGAQNGKDRTHTPYFTRPTPSDRPLLPSLFSTLLNKTQSKPTNCLTVVPVPQLACCWCKGWCSGGLAMVQLQTAHQHRPTQQCCQVSRCHVGGLRAWALCYGLHKA